MIFIILVNCLLSLCNRRWSGEEREGRARGKRHARKKFSHRVSLHSYAPSQLALNYYSSVCYAGYCLLTIS